MRRSTVTAMAVVLALLPFGGANAGTADDPEITDGCGDRPIVVEGDWPPPWLDTDTAWLTGDSEVLVLTMDMCADVPPGLPASMNGGVHGLYLFGWDVGGCVQYVRVDGPPMQAKGSFREKCGTSPEESVEIPASDIVFAGDRVEMTLRFDGPLAPFAFDLGAGQTVELSAPRTVTHIRAGNTLVEGENSGPGRSFVLRPPGG